MNLKIVFSVVCASALMQGCVSVAAYEASLAQKKKDELNARTVVLAKPIYGKTYTNKVPKIVELTTIVTHKASAVLGPDSELWLVSYSAKWEPQPIATWPDIRRAFGNVAPLLRTGKMVNAEREGMMLCSGPVTDENCQPVEKIQGRVIATADGANIYSRFELKFGPGEYKEPVYPIRASELAVANKDIGSEYERIKDRDKKEDAAKNREIAAQEAARINAWKNARVGDVDFCQSYFLKARGVPLGLGDTLNCNRGRTSINELRSLGWEVVSTSRQDDVSFTGEAADQISVTVRKVARRGK